MLTELETQPRLPGKQSCKHYGVCGGCTCRPAEDGSFAPPPYSEQLAAKEALVRRLLAPYEVASWRPILASPEILYYRNKMEYAFGLLTWTQRELVLGLRQAGRFDRIVDLETCLLMSPESVELLRRVRVWAKQFNLSGFDRGRHQGDLRYCVVREGKNTRQRMAVLIVSAGSKEHVTPALDDLRGRLEPLLTTFWVGYTDSRSDVARAEDTCLLWGPGQIQEKIGPLTYRISPTSFFQTNTRATEQLYRLLGEWGAECGGALLDLYCGSGGIGLSLAAHFDRVVGIDTNAEAIQDAQFNAVQNGCLNTEFVATDAEDFLKKLPASKLAVQLSAVVVDPPRPGLLPKALRSLIELNPGRLAYVSCNPEALARDLQSLVPFYKIQTAQAVDLFPHTPHVETLVTLEHR